MSQYRYLLIDEFGGACSQFLSKLEATTYITAGMVLKALPRQHKVNLYEIDTLLLKDALI